LDALLDRDLGIYPVHKHYGDERDGGEQLDRGVPRRDPLAAGAAAAAQKQPREDRNVVVRLDRRLARGAVGAREGDRLPEREPVGHHVEERADDEPERSCERCAHLYLSRTGGELLETRARAATG